MVALSEGCHNSKEMIHICFRTIQYLVKTYRVNVIITESGFPESRIVYDYLQGNIFTPEEINQVFNKGINIMYLE